MTVLKRGNFGVSTFRSSSFCCCYCLFEFCYIEAKIRLTMEYVVYDSYWEWSGYISFSTFYCESINRPQYSLYQSALSLKAGLANGLSGNCRTSIFTDKIWSHHTTYQDCFLQIRDKETSTMYGVTLDPTPVPQPNIFKLLMPDNEELVGTLYVCYSIGMVCSLFQEEMDFIGHIRRIFRA